MGARKRGHLEENLLASSPCLSDVVEGVTLMISPVCVC